MRVIVFTKYPLPGKVKTRLGRDIGHEHAAGLQKAFLFDQLNMLTTSGATVTICCDPILPLTQYKDLLGPGPDYAVQRGHDLGQRMRNALHDALAANPGPVLLIGSDLPDLPAANMREAAQRLTTAPACLGPTPDGGFYLLGLTRPLPADIFDRVAWGETTVLASTVDSFARHGLQPALVPSWPDVDTRADLIAYVRRNRQKLNHTMRYLAEHDPARVFSNNHPFCDDNGDC